MTGTAALLVATLLGAEARREIEVGWQPLPDGGLQYLIQIDPQMVEILRAGFAAESDIHPNVKDVRSFRISIGTGRLPRQDPPLRSAGPLPTTAARPGGFTPAESGPGEKLPWSLPGGRPTSAPAEAPAKLPPNLDSKPVPGKRPESPAPFGKANAATFEQAIGDKGVEKADEPPSPRPWTALTLTLAGLFGSLGGNVYLGWLFLETRRRYHALLRREGNEPESDWDSPPEGLDDEA